jgi:two-component system phosphate regulon sensor histidine kinase PhoR
MRFSQTAGMDMLYASTRIESQGEEVGFSRVALPLTQVQNDLNQFRRNMLLISLSMVVVAMLMGFLMAGRISKPILSLSEVVREIAGGDLSKRLYSRSEDEIGQLTRDIDTMSQQLYSQFEELQSEESKLSAILEQMTDGVVMVNQKGEVVLINQKAIELFQLSSQLPASRSLIQVLGHHEFVELWQRCLNEGKEQSDIVELYRPRRFIQGVATSLDGYLEGNILLIFQDLTSVRRLETVRRDFISNISHELRTPLASLKALAETLQAGAINDPPAATRFISQIEIEVDALNQMTSELLELARIESQQTSFEFTPTPSCLLLEETTNRLRLQAERAGVSIFTNCPQILPDIMADQIRLEQVFVNLIHNAIKFTPPGGEIQVSAEQVEDTVQYSIQDNGRGIPEKDLSRIFERFYKTDKARSGGGTGLGLAIAKHIVEAHGGRIWAVSMLHQGSTFYFRIPAIIENE